MVPTTVPVNVDYMAIAMEERARIRDKMPFAILNVASGSPSRVSSTADDDASPSSCSSDDAEVDIFTYARQGNIERIRAVIESGEASATNRNGDGITPLHLAAITGGSLPATPLQWSARKGLVEIMDLLIQYGANPRLVDSRDFSCLHSVTHSSDNSALLYILCQPDIAVNETDNVGRTPLHWAAQQGDDVSVQILLKFGANPNVVDRNGLTALHWAASGGNRSCISQLLEAGADVSAVNRDHRKAREMAVRYDNSGAWNAAVEELGFKADGTRVRRPLSEPGVKIIIFLSSAVDLGICFTIASIFPWYMSIFLSPLALGFMTEVEESELLQRDTIKENFNGSPSGVGTLIGYALWMAYAWVTRLRYDVPNNPAIHAIFLFLFVISMLTLLLTVFCDPGICATETKDGLKPIIEDLVRGKRLDTFCIKCKVVKPQRAGHCSYCNKCVTYQGIKPRHVLRVVNCINMKNFTYFVIFILSHFACLFMFDYLVWKHLLALKDTPLPSRWCVLPDTVCKRVSADMFLVSITVWSPVEIILCGQLIIDEVRTVLTRTRTTLKLRVTSFFFYKMFY